MRSGIKVTYGDIIQVKALATHVEAGVYLGSRENGGLGSRAGLLVTVEEDRGQGIASL